METRSAHRDPNAKVLKELAEALGHYWTELRPRAVGDGRREDQLRAPVYTLLKSMGTIIGRQLVVHDEVTLNEYASRPDFAIDAPLGRLGFVELKAPGKGIPETANWKPTKHDRNQWANLSKLPNIIYTNGTEWGLYRGGRLLRHTAIAERSTPRDSQSDLANLYSCFYEFLQWKPTPPHSLASVIAEIAPLCRILRDQVSEALAEEADSPARRRPLTRLADEWRTILFPRINEDEFADAYAQTVTFALLMARVDGVDCEQHKLADIAELLGKKHSLMGEALGILTNTKWAAQLSVLDVLRRIVGTIDWDNLEAGDTSYADLYERFLATYDPELRRRSGTYYTPDAVARSMVRFTDIILKRRLQKPRGLASDDVMVVDPAMGAGTFLIEVLASVAETIMSERGSTVPPKSHLHDLFSRRLVGFEMQVAPFAVAEMRLHHTLRHLYDTEIPRREVRFLNDTLDDPDSAAGFDLGQLYDVLKESRDGANDIKRRQPVMVVIGNPPWRERAHGEAPWLEESRDPRLVPTDRSQRPSMDDFRAFGQGRREFNLSNMWTFFWRWSTWKVFDANPDVPSGVVVLITPKAYVTSAAYSGMRRYLRETADEGWIIDLSPEGSGFQSPVATRLFPNVQQPICIGVFARYGEANASRPAEIHRTVVIGTREEKFAKLLTLDPDDSVWELVADEWESPFQPQDLTWDSLPALSDLMPWQQPGVKTNRNWVYAPDVETLHRRWRTLLGRRDADSKRELFKETRDRKIDVSYPTMTGVPSGTKAIAHERTVQPSVKRVAFRSFDRQYVIMDRRVIDFPRPELWLVQGSEQVYVSELHTHVLTDGPAVTFSSLVPDMHCLMGHHGGRVLPLYRDASGVVPNVAPRLLQLLSQRMGKSVTARDLLAYVAAVVAHSGYTKHFSKNLQVPGVRLPLTANKRHWDQAVDLGREVLWLHTYGERYFDDGAGRPQGPPRAPQGRGPRYLQAIPADEGAIPFGIRHDAASESLLLLDQDGDVCGRVGGVTTDMWNYNVGGTMAVIKKWFSYRQASLGRKRISSELDKITTDTWSSAFDDEMLDLLHVVARCTRLESLQQQLMLEICQDSLLLTGDLEREGVLPVPSFSRKPPRVVEGEDLFTGK